MSPEPGRYPSHCEVDAVTSDGRTVHLRPITSDDAGALVALHERLSPRSVYLRFFSAMPRLSPEQVRHLVEVDWVRRMALVAELDGAVVAVARYDAVDDRRAEAAFVVEDAHQGRGIGTLLLEHLAARAREVGFDRLVAATLPENRTMQAVLRSAGFAAAASFDHGVVVYELDLTTVGGYGAVLADREQRAAARSVEPLLAPRVVAVAGVSAEGGLGSDVLEAVRTGGFPGEVVVVHPRGAGPPGVRVVRRWEDLRTVPDLAVVALPADVATTAAAGAAAAGVAVVCVCSDGFDRASQLRELVRAVRRHGGRVLGPASAGVVNTDPARRLVAVPRPVGDPVPEPGPVAVVTDWGLLSAEIVRALAPTGVAWMIDVGDGADIGVADPVARTVDDDRVTVAAVAVSRIPDGRRLATVLPAVARRVPVIVHAAALGADGVDGRALATMATQSGAVVVADTDELAAAAAVLARGWPPSPSLTVVGDAPGPVTVAARAARTAGLDVHRRLLPFETPVADVEAAVTGGLERSGAVLVTHHRVDTRRTPELLERLGRLAAAAPGRVAVVTDPHLLPVGGDLPAWASPERAARALAAAAHHGRWRGGDQRPVDPPPGLADATAELLSGELTSGRVGAALRRLGLEVAPAVAVTGPGDARAAAGELGWPVAVKAARRRAGVGEAAGVALDVHSPAELEATLRRMEAVHGDGLWPVTIQRMVPPGVDLVVEAVAPAGGPVLVTAGAGGRRAEAPTHRSSVVAPVTRWALDRCADEVAGRLGIAPGPVATAVGAVAALTHAVPGLRLLRCNPVIVHDGTPTVTDLVVEAGEAGSPGPLPRRALPEPPAGGTEPP